MMWREAPNFIVDGNSWKESEGKENKGKKELEEIKWAKPIETQKKVNEILSNSKKLKRQLKDLNSLRKRYENWKLWEKAIQYEQLMKNVRKELDTTVPNIIEMNKEIDINYYMKHPKAAEKKAKEIVSNYENMGTIELVDKILKNNKYLKEESKEKLYKVVNKFDSDIRDLLDKRQKVADATIDTRKK